MKKATEKLFLFLIPLLFTFPLFKENISSFFFILLAANTVLHSVLSKSYRNFNLKRALALSIPFWIIVVSCLVRGTLLDNLKDVNHALFFLLFPVIFGLIPVPYFSKMRMELYFSVLKHACLIVCIGFVAAFFIYHPYADFFRIDYGVSSFRNFVYYEIGFFRIHPTYFTAILLFCICISLDRVFRDRKMAELPYIFVFIALTFLLLARINIICIVILIPFMLLFRSGMSNKNKTIGIVTIAGLMVGFILLAPGVKARFVEFYSSVNKPPVGLAHDSTNIRVSILKCSIAIAEDHWLWGVDFQNLPNALHACFEANYNSGFYKEHYYLTHNYFAYIFLSTGIIGLLFLLYYVFCIVKVLRKINSFPMYVAAINVLLICFTEDYFYRQFGLLYFNLLLLCFIGYTGHKKTLPSHL